MRSGLCVWIVLGLGAGAAGAGEVVRFADGRSLEVRSWEADGELAHLELSEGGRIAVPLSRIATVESKPVLAPAVAVPELPPAPVADWRTTAGEYAELIARVAERHDLDPALLAAIARVESGFDPFAVSHKGACGLLQLLPETAERFGVDDVFDVEQNVRGGASYLRWLLDRFEGRTDLALAAYNAGEGAVDRHGGIPPYPETLDYVDRVLDHARR